MARRNKSYAQGMQEYAEEKRFLRKIRHRAFHPDYESPLLFRLGGYFVRLVVLTAIVAVVLFVRNRKYFNGDAFRSAVQVEMDHFLGSSESEMPNVNWKNNIATLDYAATGGPHALFKEVDAKRITARAKWSDLLLNEGWTLENVGVGDLLVRFRAGGTADAGPKPGYTRKSGPLHAAPDFSKTRFGEITLHAVNLHWGPHWTSQGSMLDAAGYLKRELGQWYFFLEKGMLSQNWLYGLKLVPSQPLKVFIKDGRAVIENGYFTLGKAGEVTVSGSILLGESPELDIDVVMKTINIRDLLDPDVPENHRKLNEEEQEKRPNYHHAVAGICDLTLKLTGSPNRSEGVVIDGELVFAEDGRLREIPILRTLSVITPRSELRLMPLRSGSRLTFRTRKGVLTVKEMDLVNGEDIAKVQGSFDYQMDTRPMESLIVEALRGAVADDEPVDDGPELGFKGEARIGMPWEMLGKEEAYRAKHFTQDENGFGWITIPLTGALDELTYQKAKEMDHEWAELGKRATSPFGEEEEEER